MRVADGDLTAFDPYRPGLGGPRAEKSFSQFRTSGSDQPGQAHHFPGTDFERGIADDSCARKVFGFEEDRAGFVGPVDFAGRKHLAQLAAYHGTDQPTEVLPGHRTAVDHLAVTQDGDPIGNPRQLFEPMRDEDDGDLPLPQLFGDAEEFLHFTPGERRGRLVHDDQAACGRHGAGDFDQLLFRRVEIPDQVGRLQGEPEVAQKLLRLIELGLPPQSAPPAGDFTSQEEIRRHGQVRGKAQLLMDHRNAQTLGVDAGGDSYLSAFPQDFTRIGQELSGENLHQGGFARAVFPHQAVNLSGGDFEVSVAEDGDAGEGFVDSAQPEPGRISAVLGGGGDLWRMLGHVISDNGRSPLADRSGDRCPAPGSFPRLREPEAGRSVEAAYLPRVSPPMF